jgi:hypothetical protein
LLWQIDYYLAVKPYGCSACFAKRFRKISCAGQQHAGLAGDESQLRAALIRSKPAGFRANQVAALQ